MTPPATAVRPTYRAAKERIIEQLIDGAEDVIGELSALTSSGRKPPRR